MKHRSIRSASSAVAAMLLAVGAFAQSPLDAARLLEEAEFNPGAAALAYEKIAKDPAAKDEDRTEALLRKGLCLTRLDRTEDARAAFAAAAKGQGPAATTAAEYLEGRLSAQDEELDRRIAKAIANLAQEGNIAGVAMKELRLIGRRGVPALIAAIEHSDSQSTDIFACVRLVLELGGDDAVAFLNRVLTSKNEILRRTVAQGFADHGLLGHIEKRGIQGPDWQQVEPIAGLLRRFLADPDPSIRERVFTYFGRMNGGITIGEIDVALADAARAVRLAALQWLQRYDIDTSTVRAAPEWDVKILPKLREILHQRDRALADAAFAVAIQSRILSSVGGFDFFVELLGDPLESIGGQFPASNTNGQPLLNPLLEWPELSKSKLTEATKHLIESTRRLTPDERKTRWTVFAQVVGPAMRDWRLDDVRAFCLDISATSLEADAMRPVFDSCRERLRVNQTSIDRETADVLFRVDPSWTESWNYYLRSKVPSDEIPGFFEYAEPLLALPLLDFQRLSDSRFIFQSLLTWPKERARVLIERISKSELAPMLFSEILSQTGVEGYPMEVAVLCAGVTLPRESQSKHHDARTRLLNWFWSEGTRSAIRFFREFYHWGVSSGWARALANSWETKYDDAAIAEIITGILNAEASELACKDVGHFLKNREGHVSDVIVKALTSSFRVLPGPYQTSSFVPLIAVLDQSHPSVVELERSLLAEGDEANCELVLRSVCEQMSAELRPEVEAWMTRTEVSNIVRTGAYFLNRIGAPTLPTLLRQCIARKNAACRRAALESMVRWRVEGVSSDLKKALTDDDSEMREIACNLATTVIDRELVPDLVRCLKDPVEEVRVAAKKALDAITYYQEQESRWKRLAEGTGLESTSAAEALLKKADASQKKEVRLLAISSLGTLGVAETLPMLIAMAEESDAEIAAAARAAIEKINAGTRR